MPRRRNVKVLLTEDRPPLGFVGDVVGVRPGFARNYLLPTGRACLPTDEAIRRMAKERERAAALRAQREAELKAYAERLAGMRLTFEEKASEEGHLFGSVGPREIVASLGEQGVTLEEKQIELERPLKELGIFEVGVTLGADAGTNLRVWVIDPGEEG